MFKELYKQNDAKKFRDTLMEQGYGPLHKEMTEHIDNMMARLREIEIDADNIDAEVSLVTEIVDVTEWIEESLPVSFMDEFEKKYGPDPSDQETGKC